SQKLIDLYPNFPPAHTFLCQVYLQNAMFEQAVVVAEKVTQIDNALDIRAMLARAYAAAGRRVEAQKLLDELESASKQKHLSPVVTARIYVALGDNDRAFALLQTAFDEKEEELNLLNVDPGFDSLRSDPRFAGLVRGLNLAP